MKAIEKTSRNFLVLSVICFSLLLAVTSPVIAAEYRYISIPTPPWYGWHVQGNLDINNNGAVVGTIPIEIAIPDVFYLDLAKGFYFFVHILWKRHDLSLSP